MLNSSDAIKPYTHKAHYYETDAMGIIHHSNYIRWFEEARVDFLDQIGCSYAEMERRGVMSPVLSMHCDYKSMTRFNDTVTITAKVLAFNGFKLSLAYEVRDILTGDLRTTGKSDHCFLNTAGKPISLKKEQPDFYARLACLIVD